MKNIPGRFLLESVGSGLVWIPTTTPIHRVTLIPMADFGKMESCSIPTALFHPKYNPTLLFVPNKVFR